MSSASRIRSLEVLENDIGKPVREMVDVDDARRMDGAKLRGDARLALEAGEDFSLLADVRAKRLPSWRGAGGVGGASPRKRHPGALADSAEDCVLARENVAHGGQRHTGPAAPSMFVRKSTGRRRLELRQTRLPPAMPDAVDRDRHHDDGPRGHLLHPVVHPDEGAARSDDDDQHGADHRSRDRPFAAG